MLKSSPILIWTVWAVVLVLSICKAPARDLGQWEGADPLTREWFNGLMRPDEPHLRCCGLADAYWADSYEVNGGRYIAIITDARDDMPLGRPHIENGKRFAVPNIKIKWDRGNPTGTALSSSAMARRSIVICHLVEDSAEPVRPFDLVRSGLNMSTIGT